MDIGTGSGCILLSILKELNHSRGIGLDISEKAIRTAKINAINLDLLNRSPSSDNPKVKVKVILR